MPRGRRSPELAIQRANQGFFSTRQISRIAQTASVHASQLTSPAAFDSASRAISHNYFIEPTFDCLLA